MTSTISGWLTELTDCSVPPAGICGTQDGGDQDYTKTLTRRKGELCQLIARNLRRERGQTPRREPSGSGRAASEAANTLRAVLGEVKVSSLAPQLVALMELRVSHEILLPATQDTEANEEVLRDKTNAMTLTLPTVQASFLFSHLLSLPGALGSGLVELKALTVLVAVVRRWCIECCGREHLVHASSTDNRDCHTSSNRSPAKKRCRRYAGDVVPCSEEEEYSCNAAQSLQQAILQAGFDIVLELSQIPYQSEFTSWSSDAREVLLDAVMVGYAVAAAISTTQFTRCRDILHQTADVCEETIVRLWSQGRKRQLQELLVFVFRSLLRILQFQEVLPCGEKGKIEAHKHACNVLHRLLASIVSILPKPNRGGAVSDITNQSTPTRCRRQSSGGRTPGTGKTPKYKRRLAKGAGGPGSLLSPLLSPALKGRCGATARPAIDASPSTAPQTVQHSNLFSIIVGMLQKLVCSRGLERASTRNPTVTAFTSSVALLPGTVRSRLLHYVIKMSRSKISMHRLVAAEAAGKFLTEGWLASHQGENFDPAEEKVTRHIETSPTGESPGSSATQRGLVSLPVALYDALQERLADKIAAVRARAATSLEDVFKARSSLLSMQIHVPDSDATGRLLNRLCGRALRDETATVRKAAVLALKEVLVSDFYHLLESHVAVLCELCQDPSPSARKSAAETLTELLLNYSPERGPRGLIRSLLQEAWSTCVLPMVLDDEIGSKVVGYTDKVVVNPILVGAQSTQFSDADSWRVLAHVAAAGCQQGSSRGGMTALQVALHKIAADDPDRIFHHLLRQTVQVATTTVETGNREEPEGTDTQFLGVWCLMEALVSFYGVELGSSQHNREHATNLVQNLPDGSDFCVHSWRCILQQYNRIPTDWKLGSLRSCLVVVSKLASCFNAVSAEACREALADALLCFSFPPEATGAAISAFIALAANPNFNCARSLCTDWIHEMLRRCEDTISAYIHEGSAGHCTASTLFGGEGALAQTRLVRSLFTVGEVSMIGFRLEEEDHQPLRHKDRHGTRSEDPVTGLCERPSQRMQQLVKTLLARSLPGPNQIGNPASIRAHAFTVLGKLCLRDGKLAKESLTILARELHPSAGRTSHPAVQSNALLAIGDLCVRYTSMTDRYLPIMASCLQAGTFGTNADDLDDSAHAASVVRRHAVLLLSSLLLQDYIKWRGLLFHRFLVAYADVDETVCQLVERVLSGPLRLRSSKLFFNHFVESLFVLNRCTEHQIYIAAAAQGDGGSGVAVGFEGINLRGTTGEGKRRHMYDFLISKLSDEEKIGVTARLAKEVLGGALDSSSGLGRVCELSNFQELSPTLENTKCVLTDAFYVLTHKGLRVSAVHQEAAGEDPNIAPNSSRQLSMAKGRLMSKISRKHLIETVLPILCHLKTKLQSSRSPLLKDLMLYLLSIFKGFKTEVQEFLVGDPTLMQELEYDARVGSQASHQDVVPPC